MAELKSARHHWWPECVSRLWGDQDGHVNWLKPDGTITRSPAKHFGVIRNGHHIKFGDRPDEHTVWDVSFESEFDQADNNFPAVIAWLESLPREHNSELKLSNRMTTQAAPEANILMLVEGIVSLVVRGPMYREASIGIAERFRGPIHGRERDTLIGANIRQSQKEAVKRIGSSGKFVIIYSPKREFIFGDGFYHNIPAPLNGLIDPKILVPLTPNISVLYARPMSYRVDPKLFTIEISESEAISLNQVVQVYSKSAIYFRSEAPAISEEFKKEKHLRYTGSNPVDKLIQAIPGVSATGTFNDFFRARL